MMWAKYESSFVSCILFGFRLSPQILGRPHTPLSFTLDISMAQNQFCYFWLKTCLQLTHETYPKNLSVFLMTVGLGKL